MSENKRGPGRPKKSPKKRKKLTTVSLSPEALAIIKEWQEIWFPAKDFTKSKTIDRIVKAFGEAMEGRWYYEVSSLENHD